MEWGLARKLAVLLLLPIAGCGSGEGEVTSNSATPLLIQRRDLPPGEVLPEVPPKPCSPMPLLEQQDAVVDGTPLFRLENEDFVGEFVGVAPSTGNAQQALAELQDRQRMECIQSAIESFGLQEGDSVSIGEPKPRAEGDEGSMVQLTVADSASRPVNFATVISLRSGHCVGTLLFLTKGRSPKEGFVNRLSGRAYERLEGGHRTCR